MTFKDLQKAVQSQQSGLTTELNTIPRDIPFWIFDKEQHKLEDIRTKGQCCFWHIIKPPQKDGRDMPVLPYQKILYEALQNHKRIAILKARGIGITTFLVRYIAWCCFNKYETNSRVLILTGPRIQLSQDLIARFKALFPPPSQLPETEKAVAIINNVRVEAFPSFHCSAARGYTDVRFILVDEASFWPPHQIQEVMGVVSGYISKPNSQSQIVFCSTPNKPGDMMHQLMTTDDEEQQQQYYQLRFDYRYGLEGPYPIYSQEQIDEAINSREFPREMMLRFVGTVGNVFSQSAIDRAIELGSKYDGINKQAKHFLGCDPGFSSSSFGLVCLEYSDGIIKCVYADEFPRSSFNGMVQKIWEIRNLVGTLTNTLMDSANVEFIEAVKMELGEDSNWQRIHDKISWCKKLGLNNICDYMQVVPVSFAQEGASMLAHCKNLLEHEDNLVAINPKWEKLVTALRSCSAQEYKMDKEQPHSDIMDAYRLAMKFFSLNKG